MQVRVGSDHAGRRAVAGVGRVAFGVARSVDVGVHGLHPATVQRGGAEEGEDCPDERSADQG